MPEMNGEATGGTVLLALEVRAPDTVQLAQLARSKVDAEVRREVRFRSPRFKRGDITLDRAARTVGEPLNVVEAFAASMQGQHHMNLAFLRPARLGQVTIWTHDIAGGFRGGAGFLQQ